LGVLFYMQHLIVRLRLFLRFLRFYWSANTLHDIHSPLLAGFIHAVLEDNRHFYAFSIIEQLRAMLLRQKQKIEIKDYGAGSQVDAATTRSLANLARYAAVPPAVGKQYFRLSQHLKPATILELGTSLGISGLYLAGGAIKAKMVTIEGCPNTAQWAKRHFQKLGMHHLRVLNGTFDQSLPEALGYLGTVDLLHLDGDHQKESTLRYVHHLLPFISETSVFIIGDIHWSPPMQEAWQQLKAHPKVTRSLDFFHYGVLFFDAAAAEKQHYAVVPKKWKPWRLGLWGRTT
jgi:predicted O-methyltransferase YrrM